MKSKSLATPRSAVDLNRWANRVRPERERVARAVVTGLAGSQGSRYPTVVARREEGGAKAGARGASRVDYFLPACFFLSAQYFFMRSPTALR